MANRGGRGGGFGGAIRGARGLGNVVEGVALAGAASGIGGGGAEGLLTAVVAIRGLSIAAKGLGAAGGPATAAVLAWAAAAKMAHEIWSGGADDAKSWTQIVGRAEESLGRFIGGGVSLFGDTYTKAFESTKKLEEAEKNLARQRDIAARNAAQGAAFAGASNARFAGRQSSNDTLLSVLGAQAGGMSGSGFGKQFENSARMQNTTAEIDRARLETNLGTKEQRGAAMDRLIQLEEQRVKLIADSLGIERDIAREKVSGAEKVIEKLSEEKQKRGEIIKLEQDKLKSAAEKFADMDPDQQRRLIELKKQADAAGRQPGAIGERIRAQFTKEDRGLLRGLGLGETDEAASRSAIEAAERAGFSQNFGGRERANIDTQKAIQGRIDTVIKDQREFVARVERDDDAIAKRVATDVAALLVQRDQLLEQKIAVELRRELAKINQAQDQRQVAAGAGIQNGKRGR